MLPLFICGDHSHDFAARHARPTAHPALRHSATAITASAKRKIVVSGLFFTFSFFSHSHSSAMHVLDKQIGMYINTHG